MPSREYENFLNPYVIFYSPCDNDCIFCSLKEQNQAYHKSFSELKSQIDKIFDYLMKNEYPLENIYLIDGEPTENENFIEIVKYAKQKGFKRIYLDTHGQKFSSKFFCQQAIQAGLTDINMPIYGHTAFIHEAITMKKMSFVKLLKAINNLLQLNVNFYLHTLILKQNFKYLPNIAQLINNYNLSCSFNFFLPDEKEKIKNLTPEYDRMLPYFLKAKSILNNKFQFEDIPNCVLKSGVTRNKKKKSGNFFVNSNKILFFGDEDYASQRLTKIKLKFCTKCDCFDNCDGIFKGYAETYGVNEFKQINL